MVRLVKEDNNFRLFSQHTLSICTVLEKLLSYSQDSLYFLLMSMLLAQMCHQGILQSEYNVVINNQFCSNVCSARFSLCTLVFNEFVYIHSEIKVVNESQVTDKYADNQALYHLSVLITIFFVTVIQWRNWESSRTIPFPQLFFQNKTVLLFWPTSIFCETYLSSRSLSVWLSPTQRNGLILAPSQPVSGVHLVADRERKINALEPATTEQQFTVIMTPKSLNYNYAFSFAQDQRQTPSLKRGVNTQKDA